MSEDAPSLEEFCRKANAMQAAIDNDWWYHVFSHNGHRQVIKEEGANARLMRREWEALVASRQETASQASHQWRKV
jgi:hypothetical protein